MCVSCETLLAENEALMERYQIVESGRYAAERQVAALKRELHGSTSPENKRVQEICAYHDDLWHRVYPKAKGLTYPLDGVNAKAVRKVLRWGFKVEQIKAILDGAFASDFHRKTPKYLYLSSVLGDENKIRNHLERIEQKRADELLSEGLRLVRDTLNVGVEEPVDRVLRALEAQDLGWRVVEPFAWLSVCPVCARELRVEERLNGWARVQCGACELPRVLEALWLEPADLARNFVPEVAMRAAA